jgi:hypothetical protein
MWGRWLAALGVACACGRAQAQDSTVVFEASESTRFWWTELAQFDDSPKAWDGIVSPEIAASLRAVSSAFEARVEVGALADRFAHFEDFDADSLRAMVQAGFTAGGWTALVEWEGFDVFEPGIGDFYIGFNTYDLRLGRPFTLQVLDGRAEGLFYLSLTGGYVATTYDPLDKHFVEVELEWVQRFGGGVALAIAPKIELAEYARFPGGGRRDATFGLRVAPTLNIAEGVTITLEGQATAAVSTVAAKTGESWAITPIVRFQTAL